MTLTPLRPPQKPIPAFIYTAAGWLHGTLHVPTIMNLLDFLNAPEELLKLTDAVLRGTKNVQPFLALHKSAALLVLPEPGVETLPLDPNAPPRDRHLVTCLLRVRSEITLPIAHGAGRAWVGERPQAWWAQAKGARQRQAKPAAMRPEGWGPAAPPTVSDSSDDVPHRPSSSSVLDDVAGTQRWTS